MELSLRDLRDLIAPEPTAACCSPTPDASLGKRIVILQRGWIVVGEVYQSGNYIRIENGSVVRRWGTTKGIGELAESGPLENTKLDPVATVHVHELGVVASVECNSRSWS